MNDKSPQEKLRCALCNIPIMGIYLMLTVYPETPDEDKLPFCSDTMGCRRRAFKILKELHATYDTQDSGKEANVS